MPTFLSNVVDDLLQKEINLSSAIFILPNKRAGNFFKNELKSKIQRPLVPNSNALQHEGASQRGPAVKEGQVLSAAWISLCNTATSTSVA